MRQTFRAIFSDFDGTMVGRERILSKPLKDAVSEWTHAGGLFTIATDNQYLHIKDFLKELGLRTPQIVRAGSEILDPVTGETLWEKKIHAEVIAEIVMLFRERGIQFYVEHDELMYTWDGSALPYPKIRFRHIKKLPFMEIPKVVVFLAGKKQEDEVRLLLSSYMNDVTLVKSKTPRSLYFDITARGVDKGRAAVRIMKWKKLHLYETVGIGDSYNDLSLWKLTGLTVATGNAPEDIKEIVDYIAPSCNKNGVARVIQMLMGLQYGQMELV